MTETAGEVERRDGTVLRTARSGPEHGGADATYVVDGRLVDSDEEEPSFRRTAVLVTLGVLYQIGRGHAVWARRAVDALSLAAAREQVRESRSAGDGISVGEALDRLSALKDARGERVRQLPRTVLAAMAAAAIVLLALGAALLIGGAVVGVTTPLGWSWSGYWSFWSAVVNVALAAGVLALWVGAALALPAYMLAAYRSGRTVGPLPGWVAAPAEFDEEAAIVTPAGVAEALAHLGVPPLTRAIREGWTIGFEVPPVRVNNRGYQAVFSLPMGVTPEMVADKGEVLARNLHRHPTEVWPAAAERAGFVDIWVADPGASKKPAPEYPLLHEGAGDVFAGVPVGVTQRGDGLVFKLVGANFVAGGQMGQGKSNLCRVVMLGAALDPLADLWVFVFANNGDFDSYRPRLARYHKGVEDENLWAGLRALEELYAETGRREARLAEVGAKKVTRQVAAKHADLRPIVALFSECHELFSSDVRTDPDNPKSPTIGKLATEYATKTVRRARKTAITCGFDTQDARADAIPPKLVALVGLNACFAVKTWRANDGFLGDGSFQAGIRATELRFNVDVGTCLVTGATDEVFEVVKTYLIAVDDDAGWDAATDVIARVMENLDPVELPAAEPVVERDHLTDLHEALRGEVRVTTRVALGRLAERDKSYEAWTFQDLSGLLEEHGARVRKYNGDSVVSRADVEAALTDRDGGEW